MKVVQAHAFAAFVKKLPRQQKVELDIAVKTVMADPEIGDMKLGDLAGVRVYKFKMNKQLALLAYEHDGDAMILYLLKLGSHENFYRDLKQGR